MWLLEGWIDESYRTVAPRKLAANGPALPQAAHRRARPQKSEGNGSQARVPLRETRGEGHERTRAKNGIEMT